MRHAKSNLNVLKKANSFKSPKNSVNSDFALSHTLRNGNFKSPTARNQFFILGLLDNKDLKPKKKTKNNFANNNSTGNSNNTNSTANSVTNTFRNQFLSLQSKKFDSGKNITKNLLSPTHSSKESSNQINIRLNLNSEIINNNYTHTSKNKNVDEVIKEKDKQIARLQRELMNSQTLINKLQKEKETLTTTMTMQNLMNSNYYDNEEMTTMSNNKGITTTKSLGNIRSNTNGVSKKKTNYFYTNNNSINTNHITNNFLISSPKSKRILSPKFFSSTIGNLNGEHFKTGASSPTSSLNVFRGGKSKTIRLGNSNNNNTNSTVNNLSGEFTSKSQKSSMCQLSSLENLVNVCEQLKKRTKKVLDRYWSVVYNNNLKQ